MFSGIVECLGKITSMQPQGRGYRLWISSSLEVSMQAGVGKSDRERVGLGDSIAINGVCLTVDATEPPHTFSVVCGIETWQKTIFTNLSSGSQVHLERALRLSDRLDGHIVQGHVDGIAKVIRNEKQRESWVLWIEMPHALLRYCAVKGSITINGVSLTINEVEGECIRVNVVPYTAEETLLSSLSTGMWVNIEVDVIARYIERLLGTESKGMSFARLRTLGYNAWPKGG